MKARVAGSVVAGFPSPAEQYLEPPLDLNELVTFGKVFSAAEGVGKPAWAMKRSKLSKRATTKWDELLTVR